MCLSIIIVNWNSTEYARECIRSVYEHCTGLLFEIIVVDNASPDGDVDALKQEFPAILLLKNCDNLGFSRANNLGVRRSSGEYILFLNPDTKLLGPSINIMLTSLALLPDAGAIGCRLLNEDLSVQTSCIQAFPTILNQALDAEVLRRRWPSSRLWGIAPLTSAFPAPAPVQVVSGACLMIRRYVFEKVGMFSEDYFMYAEDLDLCQQIVRAGYRNYYIGAASVIHYGGRSSMPHSATVMKWSAILRYFEKNRGRAYASLFRLVIAGVASARLIVLALGRLLEYPSISNRLVIQQRPSGVQFSQHF